MNSWLPLLSDWAELSRLWSGCGPLVLHLLSHGLECVLYASVGVAASVLKGWGRGCSWVLMVCGVLGLSLCSGLALLPAILAVILQVSPLPPSLPPLCMHVHVCVHRPTVVPG